MALGCFTNLGEQWFVNAFLKKQAQYNIAQSLVLYGDAANTLPRDFSGDYKSANDYYRPTQDGVSNLRWQIGKPNGTAWGSGVGNIHASAIDANLDTLVAGGTYPHVMLLGHWVSNYFSAIIYLRPISDNGYSAGNILSRNRYKQISSVDNISTLFAFADRRNQYAGEGFQPSLGFSKKAFDTYFPVTAGAAATATFTTRTSLTVRVFNTEIAYNTNQTTYAGYIASNQLASGSMPFDSGAWAIDSTTRQIWNGYNIELTATATGTPLSIVLELADAVDVSGVSYPVLLIIKPQNGTTQINHVSYPFPVIKSGNLRLSLQHRSWSGFDPSFGNTKR